MFGFQAPMSAYAPATGGDLPLTEQERKFYEQLFQMADQDRDGRINGAEAQFLMKSGISRDVLKQVWAAASGGQPSLGRAEFNIAMRLVLLAQQGTPTPSLTAVAARALNGSSLPRFEGIQPPAPTPAAGFGAPSMPGMPAAPGAAGGPGPVTPQDRANYEGYFKTLDTDMDGFVTGEQAKEFFGKSNLPSNVLAQIWVLADQNKDRKLDKDEFCIAMHLVNYKRTGGELPAALPPHLLVKAAQQTYMGMPMAPGMQMPPPMPQMGMAAPQPPKPAIQLPTIPVIGGAPGAFGAPAMAQPHGADHLSGAVQQMSMGGPPGAASIPPPLDFQWPAKPDAKSDPHLTQLKSQVESGQAMLTKQADASSAVRESKISLDMQRTMLESQWEVMKKRWEENDKELQETRRQAEEIQKEVRRLHEELTDFDIKCKQAQEEMSRNSAEREQAERDIAEQKATLEQFKFIYAQLAAEREKAEKAVEESKGSLVKITEEVQEIVKMAERDNQRLLKAQADNASMQQILTTAAQFFGWCKTEYEAVSGEVDKKIEEAEKHASAAAAAKKEPAAKTPPLSPQQAPKKATPDKAASKPAEPKAAPAPAPPPAPAEEETAPSPRTAPTPPPAGAGEDPFGADPFADGEAGPAPAAPASNAGFGDDPFA
eukprot:tig00000692_g3276.t1